jgi:hypothetical protein
MANGDKCWAAAMGGCGGGASREHIISQSQFDSKSITIQGLQWCRDEPKSVGLASLVAKNLCRDHNSGLSPADSEAARLKRALRDLSGLRQPDVVVDARLVERWLLKTTINLALQEPGSGLDVTPALVLRAFGAEPTPKHEGFFMVAEVNETVGGRDGEFGFETMQRISDDAMVMSIFKFHGWRLLYAFAGAPPVRGALRPRSLVGSFTLRFDWKPDFDADDGQMAPLSRDDLPGT